MFTSILASIVLASSASAQLVCRDYIPGNWTTPMARINVFSTEFGPTFSYLPANVTAANPAVLAKPKTLGTAFRMRTCNDTQLGIKSLKESYCNDDGTGCGIQYSNYIQIINPSTGNCLTAQHWNTALTNLTFTKCDTQPKTVYQLWWAVQSILQTEDGGTQQPGPVYDWGIDLLLNAPNKPDPNRWPAWTTARNNKTIQLTKGEVETPLQFNLLHVDPLKKY